MTEPDTHPDRDGFEDDVAGSDISEDELRSALEALLLIVDAPAATEALAAAVGVDALRVRGALATWQHELMTRRSGMDLRYVGEGWRLFTRAEYAPYVEKLLLGGARSKLTRAALETLAVIAYRQPVSRSTVSAVRGVNVDAVMRTLAARGLIVEHGTDPGTSALTYVTTELFLERLGLASVEDLPPLAPLFDEVDLIDGLTEDLSADPRFAKLTKLDTTTAPTHFDADDYP